MKQTILILSLMAIGAMPLAASSTNAPGISIDDLVNEALDKNPELNFYRAEIAAAKGERKSAGAWSNPEVSGEIGQKRVNGAGATKEGTAWSVSVSQTFEFPGRLSLRKAIANRDVQLAGLGLAQFQMALEARVRALGYDVFIAREKMAAAREVAERFEALTDVLVQRDPAGITPLLETRIIEGVTLTARRQAGETSIAAQTAIAELNQLRGSPVSEDIRLIESTISFERPLALEQLLQLARTNAFELRIRQVELEQQGFKVSLAKNERLPGVTVGPFVSEEDAGDRERIIGLGVSMPLPLWNRNGGNIDVARAREQQAQTTLMLAQRDVERRVTENALALNVKLEEMSRWRADSVKQFRDAADLADRHYRLGAVPVTTYVELQKQYLDAIAVLLDTKKDALIAAQNLEQLTGKSLLAKSASTISQP